jgi:oligo-1,6-glucosidase
MDSSLEVSAPCRTTAIETGTQPWWKRAVVYQIYPRSFHDSNGDGIGDLRGIISKLDYIKSLGVDAIWLNPIFKSPLKDGGYDISDYCDIHEDFGEMTDFDELVEELEKLDIKLIMDIVFNHSSHEHPWFKAALADVQSPFRNYYVFRQGQNGEPPNNWQSFFGGPAWEELDDDSGEYYLHLFLPQQPDLNWENPQLREELYKIIEFWLQKGVHGLRLDAISLISKRTAFADAPEEGFNETIERCYANGPRLQDFLSELRNVVDGHDQCMTVGEGPGITPGIAVNYLDENRGLNMIFHFGHMFLDQGPGGRFDRRPWTVPEFKDIFNTWNMALAEKGWGSVFLGNHDFARMVSRWGNDEKKYWYESSTMLLTLLLTQRGTPFVFAGDEIGMTNTTLTRVEDSRDVETRNAWEIQRETKTEEQFLEVANYSGRDNARTPFQWTGGDQAGFTTGEPWMPVNNNYKEINAERQDSEEESILNYFRKLTKLRREHPALSEGAYEVIEHQADQLFVYTRRTDTEKIRVVLNVSRGNLAEREINLDDSIIPPTGTLLLGNYRQRGESRRSIKPWEALVYQYE